MKHKIAIGKNHSGFWLNKDIEQYLLDEYGVLDYWGIERHDPRLIEAIELEIAKGNNPHHESYGKIKIVEIDSDQYVIEEYDASEFVKTPDSIKWINIV